MCVCAGVNARDFVFMSAFTSTLAPNNPIKICENPKIMGINLKKSGVTEGQGSTPVHMPVAGSVFFDASPGGRARGRSVGNQMSLRWLRGSTKPAAGCR